MTINEETLEIGNIEVDKGPWVEHFYFKAYFDDRKCDTLLSPTVIDVAVMVCGSVTLSGNGEYSKTFNKKKNGSGTILKVDYEAMFENTCKEICPPNYALLLNFDDVTSFTPVWKTDYIRWETTGEDEGNLNINKNE